MKRPRAGAFWTHGNPFQNAEQTEERAPRRIKRATDNLAEYSAQASERRGAPNTTLLFHSCRFTLANPLRRAEKTARIFCANHGESAQIAARSCRQVAECANGAKAGRPAWPGARAGLRLPARNARKFVECANNAKTNIRNREQWPRPKKAQA